MTPENRNQLVRGVIAVGTASSGMITADPEEAKKHGVIVAYTHWYRHDDNLSELEHDFEALRRTYMSMSKSAEAMLFYEYKDYEY